MGIKQFYVPRDTNEYGEKTLSLSAGQEFACCGALESKQLYHQPHQDYVERP